MNSNMERFYEWWSRQAYRGDAIGSCADELDEFFPENATHLTDILRQFPEEYPIYEVVMDAWIEYVEETRSTPEGWAHLEKQMRP